MAHFESRACKTRRYSTAGKADPIGDLCRGCRSLLEPAGDLREIGGAAQSTTRGSTSHSGASGTGRLIAGRVGEIIV
jgi:hypothetical protein